MCGGGGRRGYHALDHLLDLPDGEFKDNTDCLLVLVLLDDPVEELRSFLAIELFLARVGGHFCVFVDDAETDDFVAVVNELVDEPFQRELRVVVLVGAAEEGA